MIEINRLRISLPSGFEGRANRISRLVGAELQNVSVAKGQSLSGLAVPEVQARSGQTDNEIARNIATSIATQLKAV